SSGRVTSSARARTAAGSSRHCATHSAYTAAPSGSSLTSDTAGPTSIRYPGPAGAIRSAKPRSTPDMSLSRSQRDTWTTTGSAGPGRLSPTTVAWRSTSPVVPSARPNRPGFAGGVPSSTPIVPRIALTVSGASSWFFAENGSRDGGTIQVAPRGTHDG